MNTSLAGGEEGEETRSRLGEQNLASNIAVLLAHVTTTSGSQPSFCLNKTHGTKSRNCFSEGGCRVRVRVTGPYSTSSLELKIFRRVHWYSYSRRRSTIKRPRTEQQNAGRGGETQLHVKNVGGYMEASEHSRETTKPGARFSPQHVLLKKCQLWHGVALLNKNSKKIPTQAGEDKEAA